MKEDNSKLVQYLIDQCKNPKGFVGNIMIHIWNQTFLKMALWGWSNVKEKDTDVLLEIGCGGGTFLNYLARQKCVRKVYGVDISKAAVRKAARLNREFIKNNKVKLTQAAAGSLSFSKDRFNKIFAVQTHIYWTEIERAIEQIYELLAVNGEFHIICEKDKIRYHLAEYEKRETMTAMLQQCGLNRIHVFETKQWIQYQCVKG